MGQIDKKRSPHEWSLGTKPTSGFRLSSERFLVVAQYKISSFRNHNGAERPQRWSKRIARFFKRLPVDVHRKVTDENFIAGKADDSLDEPFLPMAG